MMCQAKKKMNAKLKDVLTLVFLAMCIIALAFVYWPVAIMHRITVRIPYFECNVTSICCPQEISEEGSHASWAIITANANGQNFTVTAYCSIISECYNDYPIGRTVYCWDANGIDVYADYKLTNFVWRKRYSVVMVWIIIIFISMIEVGLIIGLIYGIREYMDHHGYHTIN